MRRRSQPGTGGRFWRNASNALPIRRHIRHRSPPSPASMGVRSCVCDSNPTNTQLKHTHTQLNPVHVLHVHACSMRAACVHASTRESRACVRACVRTSQTSQFDGSLHAHRAFTYRIGASDSARTCTHAHAHLCTRVPYTRTHIQAHGGTTAGGV